ncbi:MAG: hypothetical protein ACI9QD_000647, partial [Thermoproteota archaeon]
MKRILLVIILLSLNSSVYAVNREARNFCLEIFTSSLSGSINIAQKFKKKLILISTEKDKILMKRLYDNDIHKRKIKDEMLTPKENTLIFHAFAFNHLPEFLDPCIEHQVKIIDICERARNNLEDFKACRIYKYKKQYKQSYKYMSVFYSHRRSMVMNFFKKAVIKNSVLDVKPFIEKKHMDVFLLDALYLSIALTEKKFKLYMEMVALGVPSDTLSNDGVSQFEMALKARAPLEVFKLIDPKLKKLIVEDEA